MQNPLLGILVLVTIVCAGVSLLDSQNQPNYDAQCERSRRFQFWSGNWQRTLKYKSFCYHRGIVGVVGRQALEESAGKEIMRGCIRAIASGHPGPSAEVLGLARDVLMLQPPLHGPREVRCP